MKNPAKFVVVSGVSLAIAYLLWIVFVGTFSLHELLVGVIAALLTAVGMVVVTVQYPARFSPTWGEFLSCWRVPLSVVVGTWSITAITLKDLGGTDRAESLFVAIPFRAGAEEDPHAAARRALAVLYPTITPPTVVLGVNTSDGKLLSHQLKHSPVSGLMRRLGAE